MLALMSLCAMSLASPARADVFAEVPGSPFGTGPGPRSVAFSPQFGSQGGLLATANASGNTLSVFTVAANGALSPLPGGPFSTAAGPQSVAFSNPLSDGGVLLASADLSGKVSIYRVYGWGASPSPDLVLSNSANPTSVAFSPLFTPNGGLLATANTGTNTVSLFEVNQYGQVVQGPCTYPTGESPHSVAFSPNGLLLATANGGGNVSTFAVGPGCSLTPAPQSPFATDGSADAVAFSPDSTLLATANSNTGANGNDHVSVSVFSVTPNNGYLTQVSGSPLRLSPRAPFAPDGLTFSPTGRLLAVASYWSPNHTVPVSLLSVGTNGALTQLPDIARSDGASALAMSPTGGLLATTDVMASTVSIFSLAPPQAVISAPANGAVYTLGQAATASFSCSDSPYGPGVASCVDGSGRGAPGGSLDTSTLGSHTYTVTAASRDGLTSAASTTYTVVPPPPPPPPPTASVTAVTGSGPVNTLTISCQGAAGQQCAGTMTLYVAERKHGATVIGLPARMRRKPHKPQVNTVNVAVATASFTVPAGQSTRLRVALNPAGKRLLTQFYRISTSPAFSEGTTGPPTITFAYPIVTPRPERAWANWYWAAEPCGFCFTGVDTRYFFGVPSLLPTARVKVTCHGAGCPRSRVFGPGRRSLKFDSMFVGRRFPPGTVIQFTITAANAVGRVVRWTTVPGGRPDFSAKCLPPGAARPVACAGGA